MRETTDEGRDTFPCPWSFLGKLCVIIHSRHLVAMNSAAVNGNNYALARVTYLLDGFTSSVTNRITAAVIPKLSGYTCMMVVKEGACRNTVKIHVSRTPQIPTTAQAAGMKETPKPRR